MPASCYALPIPTGDALTQDSSRVLLDCGPGWMCWELAGARNFSSSAPTSFAGFLGGPRGGEGSVRSEPAPANTGAAQLQRRGQGAWPARNHDPSAPRGAPRGPPSPHRTAGPSRLGPSSGRSGQRPSLICLWSPGRASRWGVRGHRQDPALPGWECLQIRVQK